MTRIQSIGAAVLAGAVAAGCSGAAPTAPEIVNVPLQVDSAMHAGVPHNHVTHLSGDEEVLSSTPHPSVSNAQGQAILKISKSQNSFDFKLIASNIENITQAHLHCGPPGVNGPIVVWLYPSVTATAALSPGGGRHNGVLAEGTVVAGAALNVRPTTNPICPGGIATFADLLARIREGNVYVNVHTNDGVGAINTGPGDFPGGEIRGQLD